MAAGISNFVTGNRGASGKLSLFIKDWAKHGRQAANIIAAATNRFLNGVMLLNYRILLIKKSCRGKLTSA